MLPHIVLRSYCIISRMCHHEESTVTKLVLIILVEIFYTYTMCIEHACCMQPPATGKFQTCIIKRWNVEGLCLPLLCLHIILQFFAHAQHVKNHQEPKYDTFIIDDESTINIAQVYGHGVLFVCYSIIAPLSYSRNSS